MGLICFFVVLLLAGEVYAIYRWRQRRFPRPGWLFNTWAAAFYSALLLATWALTWVFSTLLTTYDPSLDAAARLFFALTLLTAIVLVITILFTLFFRWVLNTDMNDVPD